jgi:hypothetical protein
MLLTIIITIINIINIRHPVGDILHCYSFHKSNIFLFLWLSLKQRPSSETVDAVFRVSPSTHHVGVFCVGRLF